MKKLHREVGEKISYGTFKEPLCGAYLGKIELFSILKTIQYKQIHISHTSIQVPSEIYSGSQ
ncbi:MAG: hypothetical protein AB1798_06335 [Spirochaetota bacterium]